jgi:branched-chain amino acid transport system permease protein
MDGLVSGCAFGMVAISFSYIYSTTKVFHVAHAGILTFGGYMTWFFTQIEVPFVIALILSMILCAALGAFVQRELYERLERWGATPLVLLISSLGVLAIVTNFCAVLFTPNLLQFSNSWRLETVRIGPAALSYSQIAIVVTGLLSFAGLLAFSRLTLLGKRIRAVASNPFLAEITRLRPRTIYIYVMVIASAMVAIPGTLVSVDQAMQPYNGILIFLTAIIAMIAGGIGSLTGAFTISMVLSVLQNLSLLVIPGKWAIAATFGLFIIFILVKPEGLFRHK